MATATLTLASVPQTKSGKERFRWAGKAAAQGERDGFYLLGRCYDEAEGCERNVERAKENFLIAAELSDVYAMLHLSQLLRKADPRRFVWLGNAAKCNSGSCESRFCSRDER